MWQLSLAAFVLTAITVLILKYFRKYPYLLVGWLWYLGTLVPVIGIVQVADQSMSDRYAYVPLIGLFVITVWGGHQIISQLYYSSVKKVSGLVLLIIPLFAAAAFSQVSFWRNTDTLFKEVLRVEPQNYIAYNALGLSAEGRGEYEKALYCYYMAIKINNRYVPAYNNAGNILMNVGKVSDAIKSYKEALSIDNRSSVAHNNLGVALALNKNLSGALFYFIEAVKIKPDYFIALNNLALTLEKMGRYDEAIENYKKILAMNPNEMVAKISINRVIEIQKR